MPWQWLHLKAEAMGNIGSTLNGKSVLMWLNVHTVFLGLDTLHIKLIVQHKCYGSNKHILYDRFPRIYNYTKKHEQLTSAASVLFVTWATKFPTNLARYVWVCSILCRMTASPSFCRFWHWITGSSLRAADGDGVDHHWLLWRRWISWSSREFRLRRKDGMNSHTWDENSHIQRLRTIHIFMSSINYSIHFN